MEVAVGREEGKNGKGKETEAKEMTLKGAKQWRILLSSQQRAPLVL